MSEQVPSVETIIRGMFSPTQGEVRAAFAALITHCVERAVATCKERLPVASKTETTANHSEPSKSSPAPASASARAEAYAEAKEDFHHCIRWWDKNKHGSPNDVWNEGSRMVGAIKRFLALPEPDECAGLRLPLAWLDNDGTFIRSHNAMREEIRRLIAERDGK